MQPLSVTIITKNEQSNIERCLQSVQWADEIIVVDSGSTDDTLEICRTYKCKIIETEWRGFGLTKQFAVKQATYNWILSVDADEEVTPDLTNKIQAVLREPKFKGYRIKRNSFYLGKMIRFSGWQKDFTLRLFNRNHGNFNSNIVHESVKIEGTIGHISAPLLHYTYPDLSSHVRRMDRYAELGAEQLWAKGKRASIISATSRAAIKFIKMYILKMGFLDGKIGFILATNSAYGVFLKYLKLWEKNR